MASFFDTVMARTPVLFVRGDELGVPVTIADHSGNDNDLEVEDGSLIFGQQSGVETDAAARSIYIPGDFVGNIGVINVPPAELLFDGNFTVAAFVKHELTSGLRYIFARGGIAGGSGSGLHFYATGSDSRVLNGRVVTTDGMTNTPHSVSSSIPHLNDVWNFHVFVRNGPVLTLYTNAQLVGSNAAASSDPLMVNPGDDVVWGSGGNNLAPLKGWSGELIVCDFAWTQADVTEVYESAINSVFLSGRSDVVVSATLSSTFEPDPVSFPLRHNWEEPLIERLSWQSAVSSAKTGAEEAIAQRVKPRRELEFTQLLKSNTERRRFRALLWANQNRKWFIPLRQYVERLLAPLTTGAVLTPITTAWKDYETGSWIGFRQLDDDGSIRHWEEKLIVAVNVNSVEHEATENDYGIGAEVYPVKRGYVDASLAITGHTDAVEEVTITARLLSEDEEIQPNRLTPWTTAITYRDFEVWNPFRWPNNWIEQRDWEVQRQVEEVDFGAGVTSLESDTDSATEAFSWRVLLNGYEDIAEFLGWFYERRGRWRNLWVTALQEDFAPLSRNGGLTVADTNYSDAFALGEPRRDLAFVYLDNTMTLRRVTGFSGTTNETLELDQSVPTFNNLRLISLLRFCRMDADQIELHWHTNDKVEAVWRFRELTHSPEGTGVTEPSPSASVSPSVSPSVSVSLSPSSSASPSASVSPSSSVSPSVSGSTSPSPSASTSPSISPSASVSPSASESLSPSPSASTSPSSSASPSA